MKKIKTTVNRFTNTSLHEKALSRVCNPSTLHGNGVLQTKAKRKPAKYPYGALSSHTRPYVDACGVNQTVTIPIGQFDLLHVYGSASSTASKVWGNGCHKIGTSEDKKSVILTRTEKLDDMDDLFSQLGIN
jgi:hypothetical protein